MTARAEARPLEVLTAQLVLGLPVFFVGDDLPILVDCDGMRRSLKHHLNSWPGLGLVVEAMGCGFVLDYTPSQDLPWEMTFMPLEGDMGVAEAAQPWTAAFVAALRALGVDEEEIRAALEVSDG